MQRPKDFTRGAVPRIQHHHDVVNYAPFFTLKPKERNLNCSACSNSRVLGTENLKQWRNPERERD
jgi:hypothetical protein